ncbi:MAG: ABC transporter ATP-binding protein [bacterium]|nr:ABC transporter ATP-binding protein [bacterium]
MSDIILQVKDLVKYYYDVNKRLDVLNGLNLEVKTGEMLGVSGPSGSGKSTLLHLIGALDKPNSGEIIFNDKNINTFSENASAKWRNKKIGFIFQFYNLLPEFNVLENIFLPSLIYGENVSRKKLEEKAFALLELVHLEHKAKSKPTDLSGGEQQRVAIARALVNDPELILADEPTGSLDKENSDYILNLIMGLNENKKKTFIIVTHNESLAKKLSRWVHLVDGIIREEKIHAGN